MRKSELVDDASRPRGILTPADREFLKGDREYEHRQTEHKRRKQIQERIYHGILDLAFIFNHMDDAGLDRAFTPPPEQERAFDDVLSDVLGLFYYEQNVDRPFEALLGRGVNRAEKKYAGSDALGVAVDFEVRRKSPSHSIEEIVSRIDSEEYDELDPQDLRTFIHFYSKTDTFDPEIAIDEFKQREEYGLDDFNEALEQRQKTVREKQARKQDLRKEQNSE